ncbi:DUF339 family protein [Heterostelium album PN500]|uniref:Succinate dehydrogenase assembly factor 2, mitochondrial n=1 Tax=Heterostelium pallidum (strain ATCC 26659 / Pp 5 / PN500) TaxID=670386 RepID=D3BET1_HETP5|nr:DUF339 family protein [Heterostelium album PN500]EFA80412.1 DUF339 family protein [Heterostelium album PN500]|eukprot:XP_020432532.1 DUF339 family protein [Heterostelium album PN500]
MFTNKYKLISFISRYNNNNVSLNRIITIGTRLYSSSNRYDADAKLSNTDILRKKLIYQSKERGMLENDLLLGSFASKYLNDFDHNKLVEYDNIIQQPDPDIYNWALNKQDIPEELNTEVMKLLQHHCQNNPLGYPKN